MNKAIFFLFLSILPLLTLFANNDKVDKDFILVIDPGHGGHDFGAFRGKFFEKTINLNIALEFGKLVEHNMPDVKVIYTRKTDIAVPLQKRSEIANKAKANVFISIHVNSTSEKATDVSGVETYVLGHSSSASSLEVVKKENEVIQLEENYKQVYDGFDPSSFESYIIFEFLTNLHMKQSLDFANIMQNAMVQSQRKNRGARQGGLLVLKEASMPSILIELGFINNPKEASYLVSQDGQKKLAQTIYKAFKEYKLKNHKKKNEVFVIDNTKEKKQDEYENISYRVQFLISSKELNPKAPNFKNIPNVDYYKEDKIYKYTAGNTNNLQEIMKIQKEVRKYYKDAFVVKFSNGKRI